MRHSTCWSRITLSRSAIRRPPERRRRGLLAAPRWAVLTSGDDYTASGKPVIDREDTTGRDGLVEPLAEAAWLLATRPRRIAVVSGPVSRVAGLRSGGGASETGGPARVAVASG